MKGMLIFFIFIISFQAPAQRVLTIGTLGFDPPFSEIIDNKGHVYGFEISFMDEICGRIHATCAYKHMQFEELFNALSNNNIDLAIGSIIITRERSQDFLFSLPYLISKGNFIVLKNKFKSVQDLRNKTIGTLKGSVYTGLAREILGENISIQVYLHVSDLLSELENTRIDAALMDEKPAQYWVAKEKNFATLGPPIKTGSGYGIMAKFSNQELIEQINKAILNMEKEGSYVRLYNIFF